MTKPIHGAPKPQNVPADMRDTPPAPCAFHVGQVVRYTNSNGATGIARVRGFVADPTARGAYPGAVYLEHQGPDGWRLGAWWFPETLESIRPL
jgi:hypothetical protein